DFFARIGETSMGQEAEEFEREKAFAPFQVNSSLYAHAKKDALIMHCMPMIRNKEITSTMADHARSALYRQAENRLHAQKALLVGLMSE
ncbi:MAG: hypothetical protein EOP09_12365, partial [Proteobacteria bacterium]